LGEADGRHASKMGRPPAVGGRGGVGGARDSPAVRAVAVRAVLGDWRWWC